MTKIEFQEKFISILKSHEQQLTDGFKYYCNDPDEVDGQLIEIAEELWESING